MWILHSCRHISVCSIPRVADTEWCTYQCQDINPAVSLSCCYQFMSCENEMVTWAAHHYLHWLYTLLCSCEVISFPYCRAYFKYTDSKKKKRGPVGVASFFCIHQSHTDSPLYRSHLLHSISQSLTLLFGFDGHVCYNHILYNRTKWMFECKSDSAGWIYLSNGHHVLPTCFFLCYPSINIIPCSDTGILLDIINLWCSVHFCNFFLVMNCCNLLSVCDFVHFPDFWMTYCELVAFSSGCCV